MRANIENMIGTVKVPVGVVGPLRINGLNANGDFLVPLATTEAALVASYARGAEIASRAGGVSAAMLNEGVLRSPGFKFAAPDRCRTVRRVGRARPCEDLKAAAEATTRYGKLVSLEPMMDNDIVFLLCRYTTGDASGQNMVTIATDALCRHIEAHCPVRPLHWFIEANFSGDKKSTYLGLITGRGRKVTASRDDPAARWSSRACTSASTGCWTMRQMANLGAMLSGQIGAQGHYANGLAAFYIATGQDAACVSESAIGFTRMERRGEDLFVSVTLPNVLVGSVGGGTGLPSQAAGLRLLGPQGQRQGGGAGRGRGGALPVRRDFHHRRHRGRSFHPRASQARAGPPMTVATSEVGLSVLQRLWIYQRERFPLARTALLLAVFTAASINVSAHLAGRPLPAWPSYLVAFVVGAYLLLPVARLRRDQGCRGRPALSAGASDPARPRQPAADRRPRARGSAGRDRSRPPRSILACSGRSRWCGSGWR